MMVHVCVHVCACLWMSVHVGLRLHAHVFVRHYAMNHLLLFAE